ncbi:MAG TPA: hypothetical protein VOA64_16660 [Candidatus Dormibacteraeota bacterium]|nr:hypothetical protein [Candidatus Dormibacteraeota bacterium]
MVARSDYPDRFGSPSDGDVGEAGVVSRYIALCLPDATLPLRLWFFKRGKRQRHLLFESRFCRNQPIEELERIFRLESERIISQDWVVRYDNRFFQLQPQSHNYAPAQSKVLVCEGRHGSITIEYRGEALRWQEIPAPARPHILSAPRERVLAESIKRKWTPPVNHPWREAARRGLEKRERRTSRGTARAPRPSMALPSASP